jgi:hypothetical protein
VRFQRGDELYERTKQLEKEWLCEEVQKQVVGGISSSLLLAKEVVDVQDQAVERRAAGERFLTVLKEAWEDHQLCMKMFTDVLMYMVGLTAWIARQSFLMVLFILGSKHRAGPSKSLYILCRHGIVSRPRTSRPDTVRHHDDSR